MDKRDLALQRSCPLIPVPRFTEFEQSETVGSRVLVGSNGVFIEIKRRWGHFIRQVGNINVTVPYGEIKEVTKMCLPQLPRQLLHDFNQMARESSNVEIGASIIWNELTDSYRLTPSTSIYASGSLLKYQLAELNEGDHLIIDCHSHSHHPAYFSKVDNKDDQHAVKFSYVVGHCHKEELSIAMRLCINGIFEIINPSSIFTEQV